MRLAPRRSALLRGLAWPRRRIGAARRSCSALAAAALALQRAQLIGLALQLGVDGLKIAGLGARLLLRAGNGELGFADLLGEVREFVLRRGARGDGVRQRLLRVLRLLLQIGGGPRRLLQVLQIGRHALARVLGAPQRVVHLRPHVRRLRPEIGDQQPADDRQRGERQGHGSAEIIGQVIGHCRLLLRDGAPGRDGSANAATPYWSRRGLPPSAKCAKTPPAAALRPREPLGHAKVAGRHRTIGGAFGFAGAYGDWTKRAAGDKLAAPPVGDFAP